jgi:hypothetical protein
MTDILEATASYERWLADRTLLIAKDVHAKHAQMAESLFGFFRATFYRWMQLWDEQAGDLAKASTVLAVGDLHVENFGTWRDKEGRLTWGVNDFDETYRLPFTVDLVRLATSAHLAIDGAHLVLRKKDACDAILQGYVEGLESGGRPFVLSEHNTWLWRLAVSESRNPKQFWASQDAKCSAPRRNPPAGLVRAVRRMLPRSAGTLGVLHRTAGMGSLGRQRYLFLVAWHGARTAREAKPVVASACVWAGGDEISTRLYDRIRKRAVRAPDPFVAKWRDWVIRRLAPDCSRIELAHLEEARDSWKLLWAMGFETANVHLGSGRGKKILKFVRKLPPRWLDRKSKLMADAVEQDWVVWRARWKQRSRAFGPNSKSIRTDH